MAIKWIVKDKHGKVRGPYSNEEVIEKIRKGFFLGEEKIAKYPDGKWTSITQDEAFYSALINILDHDLNDEILEDEKSSQEQSTNKKISEFSSSSSQATNVPIGEGSEKLSLEPIKSKVHIEQQVDLKEELLINEQKTKESFIENKNFGSSKFIKFFIFFLILVAGYVIFFNDPPKANDSFVRLMYPRYKNKRITKKSYLKSFQQAKLHFNNDTINDYIQGQNILVGLAETNIYQAEALEHLCMIYKELWPYTNQSSEDLKSVKVVLNMVESKSPSTKAARTCRTINYFIEGQFKKAAEVLEVIINSEPQDVFSSQIMGELLMNRGDNATAAFYFTKLRELSDIKKSWLKPIVFEATVKRKLKNFNEAAILYRTVLSKNKNHMVARMELGILEFEAYQHLEKARELILYTIKSKAFIPKVLRAEGLFALAKIYEKQGDNRKALNFAEEAFSLDSTNNNVREFIVQLGGASEIEDIVVDSQNMFYLGEQYMKAGNFFAAQAEFRAAFEGNQNFGMAALRAAQCMWSLSQSQNAISWLTKAIQAEPDLLMSYILLADYYSQRYDYFNAVKVLQKAQKIRESSNEVLRGYALIEFRRRNFKTAVDYAKKALKLYEVDVETLILLAKSHAQLNEYNEAYVYINRATELDSMNPAVQSYYALIAASTQGAQYAIDYLNFRIQQFPENREFKHSLAQIYINEDRYEDARSLLADLVGQNKKDKTAIMLLGNVYKKTMRLDDALEMYFVSATLDPTDAEPLFLAGQIYLEANKPKAARTQFDRVISVNPKFPMAYYYAGKSAIEGKDFDAALAYAKKEMEQNPGLAEPYLLAADAHFNLSQYSACAEEYQSAVSRNREDPNIFIKLARCYRLSGALESAEAMLNKAEKLESGNPEVYKELGELYTTQGVNNRAVEAFELYLSLTPEAYDKKVIRSKIESLARSKDE